MRCLRRLSKVICVGALAAPAFAGPAALQVPTSAKSDGGVSGQGVLVKKGDRCLVVTFGHVVDPHSGVKPILVHDSNGKSAALDEEIFRQKLPELDDDIVVLPVRSGAVTCQEDWSDGESARMDAAQSEFLSVERLAAGGLGSTSRALHRQIQSAVVLIEPRTVGLDEFKETDSGSLVLTQGRKVVGMLQSVDSKTKVGTVVRQDIIHAAVKDVVLDAKVKTIYIAPVFGVNSSDAELYSAKLRDYLESRQYHITALDTRINRIRWPMQTSQLKVPGDADYVLGVKVLDQSTTTKQNLTGSACRTFASNNRNLGNIGNFKLPIRPQDMCPASQGYEATVQVDFHLLDVRTGKWWTNLYSETTPTVANKSRDAISEGLAQVLHNGLEATLKKSGLK